MADFSKYYAMLSVRRQSELYEIWAVFTATRVLQDILLGAGFSQKSPEGFYKIKGDTFQIEVDRNASVEFWRVNVRVRARYDFEYQPLRDGRVGPNQIGTTVRTPRKPDLAIEIFRSDRPSSLIVLDAKYKTDGERFLPEDVSEMEKNLRKFGFLPNTQGRWVDVDSVAFIMYPGEDLDYEIGYETGALPLTPGGSDEQRDQFREILRELLTDFKAL